ncbi:uncharacterized protein KY384_008899 [Bacidia gigantensis]|uniref:uncharacterized protein n=1 Tax=Bacidia gigantensis TaxID=2732470 RepID=UPI001D0470D8|nr:uncharacterized protein KY384_008899 [Bacidia gigantensis]KAG8525255.1 hypothetical protein KY384_008899 [Bacidia gigantensis]
MDTPLERRIDDIRQGLLASDEGGGNGGAEVLGELVTFYHHATPPEDGYQTIRDYLDYRGIDAATSYVLAVCKFSVGSSTDLHNPDLYDFLSHYRDHIAISNDLASYEMERQGFESGKATAMINVVEVIMRVERVDVAQAKALAYAWQLYTEDEILRELKKLKESTVLGDEDWRLVDACLLANTGNVIVWAILARYGGEQARIC